MKKQTKKEKNFQLAYSFFCYCRTYPEERFWQALRNWSGHNFILVSKNLPPIQLSINDTFYFEGKDK